MKRGDVQFESHIPPGSSLDDLDYGLISAYRDLLDKPEHESQYDILYQRGCLKDDNGILRPTYAALLLFGKNPRQWVPSGYVMAARFPGISISDEFIKQEIGGPLPEQIRLAEVFVRDNLRSTVKLSGLTHQETFEYPLEAIRELLVNAIAHRDYNQGGDGIHIHIFQDRLEVHSPGGLPGPVNLDNLLTARFSRNPIITQVLSDMGFVERLGYGINRVMRAMEHHGLGPPVFEEVGGTFRVKLYNTTRAGIPKVVRHDLVKLDLNLRQEKAIAHLVEKGRIKNSAYRELCPDVSPETLRRDLVDLVKKGVLIKVGERKSTYYILKEKIRG
jgi:ATP-dependent DNA helicase RecG